MYAARPQNPLAVPEGLIIFQPEESTFAEQRVDNVGDLPRARGKVALTEGVVLRQEDSEAWV
jgi:hypothetical protein